MSLRVAWFIPVNHRDFNRMPASVWIRCLQLIPYLEERGVRCTVNEPDAKADISIFVRWQDEKAYRLAREQKGKGQRIIFDLCVNYFDQTGMLGDGYGTTAKNVQECTNMVSMSDAVTCASKFIAERAQRFHPRVVYLPDSIDGRHFRFRKSLKDFQRRPLRAIWCGVAVKAQELNPILPILADRGLGLTLISEVRPKIAGHFSFIPWTYETFSRHILDGELCISYRSTDSPYNLGHSFFKIGVFMAQGVPVLASPVPSYGEILENGNSGMICSSPEDWERSLDMILADREMLIKWSEQGVQTIERYSTEHIAIEYCNLFNQLMCNL